MAQEAARRAPAQALLDLPPAAQKKIDFVRDIQPILAKHCYACHGPDKQENGLRWDVKTVALKGGESGPVIVPGNGAESRVIHLVAGLEKNLVMPKKGERLTAPQIGLLRAWIDQGAPWPEEAAVAKVADKADFWTFKPVARPAVPEVKKENRVRNPIDRFVLAKLEQEGLSPSPEADRLTLIRRLSFDLTGLPPTSEEVTRFVGDADSQAYEKLVDRLLASPRYGERWARLWLDLVHFGETHGYDKDKLRPNSWPYRDYVIRAFNDDKPYSRFVEEQLAGDVLFPDEPDGVIATGFIAAGPWDYVGHAELPESKTDGLIARYNDRDDMVMTTMSTFQSLTVHCARCHDHKFDPIKQRDYYSLQAVFAGVDRANRPFDTDKHLFARRKKLLAEKKTLEAKQKSLDEIMAKANSPELERLDARLKNQSDQLAALPKPKRESPGNGYHSGIEAKSDVEKWVQVDLGNPVAVDQVRLIPARPTDFADTPGFGFPKRFRVEAASDVNFTDRTILMDHTANDLPNPGDELYLVLTKGQRARFIRVTATRLWERTHDYVFALAELQILSGSNNVALGASVTALDSIESGRWAKSFLVDNYNSRQPLDQAADLPDLAARRRELEAGMEKLKQERKDLVLSLLDAATRTEAGRVAQQVAEVNRQLEALPKAQMVYAAAHDFASEGSFHPPKDARPVHLLQRGEVKRPGDLMSPGTVACLPGLESRFELADPNEEGTRRVALAQWITNRKNMLTRRSIVNRIWQYHFGRGIVDTPSDFGHMGALPSHPELLDWLAYWFLDQGESIKQLHRLLVASATYRQVSSQPSALQRGKGVGEKRGIPSAPFPLSPFSAASWQKAEQIDGDNRSLWRMNRVRLDAEQIHDAILAVSGKLDLAMGGPSIRQFYFKDDHSPIYDYTRYDVDDPAGFRRSVYRHIVRSVPDPFLDCLDAADPALLTPRRNTTLTALQALATLNNPFVLRQAEHLAERVRRVEGDLPGQIAWACRLAWCRSPSADEARKLAIFAQKSGLASFCRLIFNSNEFMFVD